MARWHLDLWEEHNIRWYRILVVAEDELLRRFLADVLGFWKRCTVDTVSTGQEALCKGETARYDLAILSASRGTMETLTINHLLRQTQPLRTLGITDDLGKAVHYLAHGVDDVLAFPCTASELLEQVFSLLSIKAPSYRSPLPLGRLLAHYQ